MKPGDKLYYLHTDKNGTPIKFAAVLLALESDGILIRVGHYDAHTNEVKIFIENKDAEGTGLQVGSTSIAMRLVMESHGVFSLVGLGAFQLTASAVGWGEGSMSTKRLQADRPKPAPRGR